MANFMFHNYWAWLVAAAAGTVLPVIALVADHLFGTRGASIGGLACGVALAGATELVLLLGLSLV